MPRSIFAELIPYMAGAYGQAWENIVLPPVKAGGVLVACNTDKNNGDMRHYICGTDGWRYIECEVD